MRDSFVDDMFIKFKSGYPATAVNTTEPSRCLGELRLAGWRMGLSLIHI